MILKKDFNITLHPKKMLLPSSKHSIGASFEHYHEAINPKTLLERADKALYDAKAEGRNRVAISS